MAGTRFETLLRSLAPAPSRRSLLRLLAGSALGGLFALGAGPMQAKKKAKVTLCHQGQTIRVSKKAKQKHLKHGDTLGACPPPVPVLTYQCPGPNETVFLTDKPATVRFTQTFTAAQSGTLHQIQFEVEKQAGSTGNYLVELLGASAGVPTNVLLAAVNIPNASVPDGISILTATFSGPALPAGTEYAAALSRPGGSQFFAMGSPDNPCTGRSFWQDPSGSGSFTPFGESFDLFTTVTVLA